MCTKEKKPTPKAVASMRPNKKLSAVKKLNFSSLQCLFLFFSVSVDLTEKRMRKYQAV